MPTRRKRGRRELSAKEIATDTHNKTLIAMKTVAGRQEIAMSLQQPLRELQDYIGVGRNLLFPDYLPDGRESYFDTDPLSLSAYVINQDGDTPMHRVDSERVHVPLFEIATLVEMKFQMLRQRAYNVSERTEALVKAEIIREEDIKIFTMIDMIARQERNNKVIQVPKATAGDYTTFSAGVRKLKEWGELTCETILMHPANQSLLHAVHEKYFVDFETSKAVLATGKTASLYGASIVESSSVPLDAIYFLAEKELLGRFVIAQELQVINYEEAKNRSLGLSVWEEVGVLFHNDKAIVKVELV